MFQEFCITLSQKGIEDIKSDLSNLSEEDFLRLYRKLANSYKYEHALKERTLFDCCKAWKINLAMPQRLAKFVGTHSLKGRMLAGAIFDKMCEEGKTTPQEWRDNKVLHEKFYEELDRAEKMPREKAFQQYIPNTPVNRKRVVGMGMEEKGIENTPENFKSLYRQMREQGVFEKMLAKPEEARTTFSSRLLVETARRKFEKSR